MKKNHPLDASFERDSMNEVVERLKKGERLKNIAPLYRYSYSWMFCVLRKNGYSLKALLKAFRKYADENSIQMRLPL